jgi:hypothetical protein
MTGSGLDYRLACQFLDKRTFSGENATGVLWQENHDHSRGEKYIPEFSGENDLFLQAKLNDQVILIAVIPIYPQRLRICQRQDGGYSFRSAWLGFCRTPNNMYVLWYYKKMKTISGNQCGYP